MTDRAAERDEGLGAALAGEVGGRQERLVGRLDLDLVVEHDIEPGALQGLTQGG